MRRPFATAAAVTVTALALAACGTGDDTEAASEPTPTATATPEATATAEPTPTPTPEQTPQTEEPVALPAAFDFEAPTVEGGTFDGATLLGQDAVLYFWAPWCTVCRAEAPDLPAVANEFAGDATFYGVAGLSPDVGAMQGFVADTGTGDLTHIADTDGTVYTGFGVSSQTTFAFVNDDGTIEIVRGPLSPDEVRTRTQALIDS
jgi:thiol-disulfide isomerase/thioredoxin